MFLVQRCHVNIPSYYIYKNLSLLNWSFCFLILSALKMESDLFDLQTNFQSGMQPGSSVATAWGGELLCM